MDADPELDFVERRDGAPSVGTFSTISQADARLGSAPLDDYADTTLTAVGEDFFDSNQYNIALSMPEYTVDDEVDASAVWQAVREPPGLAIVNATIVPSRTNTAFSIDSDQFTLKDIEDLYVENDTMDPIGISVRDLESGNTLDLTVIGVLDTLASSGPIPVGFYTSHNTIGREVDATQYFFNVEDGASDAAGTLEAALFQHGVETLDVKETIAEAQSSQKALFNLLIGFMALGLFVGIVALGVISARAVVERRHGIGVLRAIGFSRRMVQLSFLAESSFIALLGIGLGLVLGLVSSVSLIDELRADEPEVQYVIPWLKVILIAVAAYFFSLLTTYLPARRAAQTAPAEALRYE